MVAHRSGRFDGRHISLAEHRSGSLPAAGLGRTGGFRGISILSFQESCESACRPMSGVWRDARLYRQGVQILRQCQVDCQLTDRAAKAAAASLHACLRTAAEPPPRRPWNPGSIDSLVTSSKINTGAPAPPRPRRRARAARATYDTAARGDAKGRRVRFWRRCLGRKNLYLTFAGVRSILTSAS